MTQGVREITSETTRGTYTEVTDELRFEIRRGESHSQFPQLAQVFVVFVSLMTGLGKWAFLLRSCWLGSLKDFM